MSVAKVYVVARMTAFPEKVEAVKELLLGLLTPTRQEAGCLRYDLYQNQANPLEFTFIEEWSSQELLEKHLASVHIRSAMEKSQSLLAEGPIISLYHPLE
jgi:quinol monooxygenase YgiN